MYKDKGPAYTLGFGIPQNQNPLDRTNDGKERAGLSPHSGAVGNALYGHPVAKFFTVSAATMIGTAVGSAMVRRGGIRLGEKLDTGGTIGKYLGKHWTDTRKLLDEWEGVDSTLGDAARPIKRRGWWQTVEHRAERDDQGLADDGERWLFRDEMQQRLVRQARSLPYQLPALYVANRAANTLVGNQNTPVNWKNPFDVIGDFAQSSTKQIAGLLAPVELGQGALKFGWQKMMTDGDFTANIPVFNKSLNLKEYGVGLKTSLDLLGQDSADILGKATKVSGRSAGAFASALKEAVDSRKPLGVDIRNHDKEFTQITTASGRLVTTHLKRAKLVHDAWQANKNVFGKNAGSSVIDEAIPTLSGFGRGFKNSWRDFDETTSHANPYIVQLADSLKTGKTGYARDQRTAAYKKILEEELAQSLAAGRAVGTASTQEAVSRFIHTADIQLPFNRDGQPSSARQQMIERVKFGLDSDPIRDVGEGWENRFAERLGAIGIADHGHRIASALPDALTRADARYGESSGRRALESHIDTTYADIRERVAVPEARRQLGESKLAYGDYGANITGQGREFLVRKTAQIVGLNTDGIPTSTLRAQLRARGVSDSTYGMRAILVDNGAMTKPWNADGFNFFGLRPLTFATATAKGYFGDRQSDVKQLFGEMGNLDHGPTRDLVSRPVGRHVWESRTGKIIDLNPTLEGLAKGAQVLSRHVELPFLHFSPLDLTSFNKLNDFANGPVIKISSAKNVNFGAVNRELPSDQFESHVWMKTNKGFRGRGNVFGYGENVDVKRASGEYYTPGTMGEDTWARNMRIAMARKLGTNGLYDPSRQGPGKMNAVRRFFRQGIEQPASIPNLLRRFTQGQFGEKFGGAPDVKNPAVAAREIRGDRVPNSESFTDDWLKADKNIEKEASKFQLPPAVTRMWERDPGTYGDLSSLFKVGNKNLSDITDPRELMDTTDSMFSRHMDRAAALFDQGKITREQLNMVSSAQARLRSVYLEGATAKSLTDPASRAVATAGINTRLDQFRGELYKYLVSNHVITTNDDTSSILEKMLTEVDRLSRQGHISGIQKTEARAAVLSMQMNIDGLRFTDTNSVERARYRLESLRTGPAGAVLEDLENYNTSLLHHRRYFGLEEKASRLFLKNFGVSKQETPGFKFNPYGNGQSRVLVPTFETSLFNNPIRALSSAVGISTWNDPEGFSALGIRTSHLATRLNRYFQMAGVGVDEQSYRGPMGYIAGGFVGRRILPLAVGSALFFGIDREIGGLVHGKDQYGNRQYQPIVSGTLANAVAHTVVVGAGILGGPDAYQKKHDEYFGDAEVPIRKGRYWPLGNQAWKGGRIQYYRPNWYKRFQSGYQYTDQTYGSPLERMAFDYDFSPLHAIDPYHFERQHYEDRPYPVTGDMFTGPWGPVNTVLNATVGKVLKPAKLMHEDEFNAAMQNDYERVGQYGMQYKGAQNPYPTVLTRAPSGGTALVAPTPTGYYLGGTAAPGGAGGSDGYSRPYDQPYGFVGEPYGTSPDSALAGYRDRISKGQSMKLREHTPPTFGYGDADTLYTDSGAIQLKNPGGSQYRHVTIARGRNFDPRIIPAANPMNPGKLNVQAGQFGYDAQEMAGIYGFGMGTARQMAGLGSPSYTPDKPVLQSASRAYGSERSFWDLNLGGLGDFPTPLRGEYGNIEFSEIARRFIPHRRRDINELNPIPNQIGKQYPWLPGSDYYINFHTGDPYIAVPEGEMRLPGQGYERTHTLHPDDTGQYGMLDKHRILGDVAPWSEEYRSVDRILRKSHLTAEEKAFVQTTRNQVAGVKKRHNFKPYKYANADFQNMDVKVVGFKPGDADQLITDAGVIQLAGVRARKTQDAMNIAQSMVHAGDTVSIQFDANAPYKRGAPVDARVTANGQDVGAALINSGQGYYSRKNDALDNRVRQGPVSFYLHSLLERGQHLNTIVNQKFVPNRSAVEEWERYHVYGTDFPQWTHPIQDFIEPLGMRARNRNPVYASTVLSMVGRAFGRTPQGKTAGSLIGAGVGSYLSSTSNAKTMDTGTRYMPKRREKELAIDEYTDMLNYVKYAHLYNEQRQEAIDKENSDPEKYAQIVEDGEYKQHQFTNLGPHTLAALQYRKEMKQTEYGADLFGDIMDESAALPKRKRDYFMSFINSPRNEHARILSTAPRLERRMYEARWGMAIENKPDLSDYFSEHELPGPGWEGWDPNLDLDNVRIKMIQQQGIEASQMGYFPQQVQQANLLNPSYPDFSQEQSHRRTLQQLQTMLNNSGVNAQVSMRRTSTPGKSVNLQMGLVGG